MGRCEYRCKVPGGFLCPHIETTKLFLEAKNSPYPSRSNVTTEYGYRRPFSGAGCLTDLDCFITLIPEVKAVSRIVKTQFTITTKIICIMAA
jgi:hypothetical protein